MTDPIVTATASRVRGCWILEIVCPHCGRRHTHGGGDGPVPSAGHRVAHCRHPRARGYFIVLDVDNSAEVRHDDLC